MPRIKYKNKKISVDRLAIVGQANEILDEYAEQGFDLTLRQLYYQFVARDLIPNTLRSYKRLGTIIDDGRMVGLIDWDRIEDRTRNLKRLSSWSTPASMIGSAYESYHRSRWANQPVRIEVWVEKEALIGIFARVCEQWDVPYFACRGYVSQSEMWRAAQRLERYIEAGQRPIILHFGDHDPSGVDMTRDIGDRLATFCVAAKVERLALNMDQVEEYSPPPNPAKQTDARFQAYIAQYGDESWELDALDPGTLTRLVESAVKKYRDIDKWRAVVEQEIDERARLRVLRDAWDQISEHIDVEHEDRLMEAEDRLKVLASYRAELEDDEEPNEPKERMNIFD